MPEREPVCPDTIADIVSEFTRVFAFSRKHWVSAAGEINPELKNSGMVILQLVSRKTSITATELGQLLDMDKSLLSRHLTRLRDSGLLQAEPDLKDRRVQLLSLTPLAKTQLAAVREKWAQAYRERFNQWNESELHTLRRGLQQFNSTAGS